MVENSQKSMFLSNNQKYYSWKSGLWENCLYSARIFTILFWINLPNNTLDIGLQICHWVLADRLACYPTIASTFWKIMWGIIFQRHCTTVTCHFKNVCDAGNVSRLSLMSSALLAWIHYKLFASMIDIMCLIQV